MQSASQTDYLHSINALIELRLKPVADAADLSLLGERDLNLASRHLCISEKSKRVRPLLCWLFYRLFEEELPPKFAQIGVAAEFIHAASLMHDDIVDDADRRRGKQSANRLFGNAHAVLAGNFLLTEAFYLLSDFDRILIDKAICVVREMTKSAMIELKTRGQIDISTETLLNIALGKTGALFAWCGYAAAYCAGKKERAQLLWTVGERIGVIFQLADDIKDFDGDHKLKDVCRDIRNRELSLPVLLACQSDEVVHQRFTQAFKNNVIDEEEALRLKDVVMNSDGPKQARAMMQAEIEAINEMLGSFKQLEAKTILEQYLGQMLI